MIRDIITQLGKIAVTSLKLGREVAREKASDTVDALKQGKAAHWLRDTLVRLGVVTPEALPAGRSSRKAPKRKASMAALPKKPAGGSRHHTAPAAHH